MSKIICDVCGTSYPDTATQCPICGCVRSVEAMPVPGDTQQMDEGRNGTYTYVKGGRFSKANVRKRTNSESVKERAAVVAGTTEEAPEGEKKNTGLVITVVVLLLAVVAVISYFALRFLLPSEGLGSLTPSGNVIVTQDSTTEPTDLKIPCTELKLKSSVIEIDSQNTAQLLSVTKVPADTTDAVTFTSSDTNVATVTAGGKITAVGPGQAIITITCGSAKAECRVICSFETVPVTEPTEETTAPTEPTIDPKDFVLNREDFTLSKKGETWQLYTGDIDKDLITWTTDNANVATIEGGKVTAVGGGVTKVHGEYGGVKRSCTVRCDMAPVTTNDTQETTPPQTPADGTYTISATDVTLKVGESFALTLKDSNGTVQNVTWTSSASGSYTISGNTITGVAPIGYSVVTTTHEGQTYECIIRVR